MNELSPEQIKPWLDLLGKPTLGLVAFVVLILYREVVIHIVKTIADIAASWLKRK